MSLSIELCEPLLEQAERFLSCPQHQKGTVCSQLVDGLRQAIALGQYDEAAMTLQQVVLPSLDYTTAQSFYAIRKKLRGKAKLPHSVRLAVIGGFTTKQVTAFIDLCLFAAGVEAELYESEFGVFRQEIVTPDSALYHFRPQIVWLAVGRRDLGQRPLAQSDGAAAERLASAEQADWEKLWSKIQEQAHCQVIQNNFVLPVWRTFANYEMRASGSLSRYIADLNRTLCDSALPFVTIHDVDHLAAAAGRWVWDDPRFVHQAKMPCAPEYLFDYAHNVASIVAVQLGLAKKCLVLDLDNTLWGGVVGEDGVGGIRLGHGSAEGEAFLGFQEYLKTFRERGILLAVCSKNNEETARDVFLNHPEMVLRLDDISCFVANWNDKATNLRSIAKQLNIALSSMVFIDDNPAERAVVRRIVPEVAVPELPEDVTGYIEEIERYRHFQTLSIAVEDFQRTQYYRADEMRREAQTSTADIDTFLKSLDMVARISPISSTSLDRAVQLIQRSNQFNLTTRRYSVADLSGIIADPASMTVTVSLRDRFGDNGLISVALAKLNGSTLELDTWLMSCRVLKRGVEHFLLNHLCSAAKERHLDRLVGEYVPTSKNDLVRGHYAELGFRNVSSDQDGRTVWELDLKNWQALPHFIRIAAD